MPSGAVKDLAKGGGGALNDRTATFRNTRWEERTPQNGGKPNIVIVSDMEFEDGSTAEQMWRVGLAEWLLDEKTHQPRAEVNDEGQFIDIDEANPYKIGFSSECGMLFESLEEQGVSAVRMAAIGETPGGIDGVKAHFVKKGTGRTYTAKQGTRAGQEVEAFTFVVESILEDEQADAKPRSRAGTSTGAGKTAAKPTTGGGKSKPAPEPEPEDEPAELTDAEQAALDAAVAVLADPKGRVKGYSAKVNGGAIHLNQMYLAGSGGAIDKSVKGKVRSDAIALLRKKDFFSRPDLDGTYWNFDADNGLVSAIE